MLSREQFAAQGSSIEYQVQARNADGVPGPSQSIIYVVPTETTAPSTLPAPGNIALVQTCPVFSGPNVSGLLTLSFNRVDDAVGYRQRSRQDPEGTTSGPGWTQWYDLPGNGNTSVTLNNPTIGDTYRSEVQAYSGTFADGPFSPVATAQLTIRRC